MTWPDVILRGSIWASLILFAAGEYGRRGPRGSPPWAWRVWTAGALVCAFHMAWAMGWAHGWSHRSAVEATAALTASIYGVAWGSGVYVNYAFLAVWLAEATWWRWGREYATARKTRIALRVFYFVIIVNAAIVFTHGATRLAGSILVALLLLAWGRLASGDARDSGAAPAGTRG